MKLTDMFKPQNLSKDSLNRYKKKTFKPKPQLLQKQATQSITKNQFQKYFLDTVNVFFQDRQTLKDLQKTNKKQFIVAVLWFIVAMTYFSINRIQPFEGNCPEHATCKVFIRCNPGYELSQDQKKCTVKASIIEQIENVCKFEIESLKQEFGDGDCLENTQDQTQASSPPFKEVSSLIVSITKSMDSKLSSVLQEKIRAFLENQVNQETYEFAIQGGRVIPLVKKHSFNCWLSLSAETTQFKVLVAMFIVGCALGAWAFSAFKKQRRARAIYEYLRQKVIKEKKVNVTLLSDEMKMDFGKIDEETWSRVDEERQKDGEIGFFEDEFLFWQMM